MPSQAAVDLRVSRRFKLGSAAYVEGLVEVFNVFNRTNFIETNNLSSAFIWGIGSYPSNPAQGFGHYTQAAPPRQGQLGIRIGF